jgi:hypothetical protein
MRGDKLGYYSISMGAYLAPIPLALEPRIKVAVLAAGGLRFKDPPETQKIRERLRSNGADLRLGLPLETQTLCRFKEVLRDVMSEKGFLDAEVTHDTQPTFGNPRHLTLKFTITEGKRSRPIAPAAPLPSPAQRCLR